MKPTKTLFVLALLVVPGLASAQGYYGGSGPGYAPAPSTQLPGGFHNRQGRLAFGFSLGLGAMNDDVGDIECVNCSAVSGQLAGHIGGFIGPRLALMGELQGNAQTLSDSYGGVPVSSSQSTMPAA